MTKKAQAKTLDKMLREHDGHDDNLLDALDKAHRQVDTLLAMVIGYDKSFFPSETMLWPEIKRRAEILKRHGKLR